VSRLARRAPLVLAARPTTGHDGPSAGIDHRRPDPRRQLAPAGCAGLCRGGCLTTVRARGACGVNAPKTKHLAGPRDPPRAGHSPLGRGVTRSRRSTSSSSRPPLLALALAGAESEAGGSDVDNIRGWRWWGRRRGRMARWPDASATSTGMGDEDGADSWCLASRRTGTPLEDTPRQITGGPPAASPPHPPPPTRKPQLHTTTLKNNLEERGLFLATSGDSHLASDTRMCERPRRTWRLLTLSGRRRAGRPSHDTCGSGPTGHKPRRAAWADDKWR
jgi:hypothetical protein